MKTLCFFKIYSHYCKFVSYKSNSDLYMIWWKKGKFISQISLANSFPFPKSRSQDFLLFLIYKTESCLYILKRLRDLGLIVTCALELLWNLFSKQWWTLSFCKLISKHGSIFYVDREWNVCAVKSCRYNSPIKN